MSNFNQVTLVSADGVEFVVDRNVMCQSVVLKNALENVNADEPVDPITLSNITSRVLAKIIDYCTHHYDKPAAPIAQPLKSSNLQELVSAWDYEFVNVDKELLFELILAENFLDIKPLLELTCAKVASLIKDKNPEQIRREFGIINDFTPEEEAIIREENKWCEDALDGVDKL